MFFSPPDQIASRKKKLDRMGFEKTEDGRKWNCQTHGIRAGSVNANEGGWKNGKRSAASQVDVIDPSCAFHLLLLYSLILFRYFHSLSVSSLRSLLLNLLARLVQFSHSPKCRSRIRRLQVCLRT